MTANIFTVRNMAGVRYYNDYIDSLRVGEEIALGALQEQSAIDPNTPC